MTIIAIRNFSFLRSRLMRNILKACIIFLILCQKRKYGRCYTQTRRSQLYGGMLISWHRHNHRTEHRWHWATVPEGLVHGQYTVTAWVEALNPLPSALEKESSIHSATMPPFGQGHLKFLSLYTSRGGDINALNEWLIDWLKINEGSSDPPLAGRGPWNFGLHEQDHSTQFPNNNIRNSF